MKTYHEMCTLTEQMRNELATQVAALTEEEWVDRPLFCAQAQERLAKAEALVETYY